MGFHIASTTPGKTWSVSASKHPGRQGTISAIEGEVEQGDGYTTFAFTMFQSRSARATVEGKMTAKNIRAAVDDLRMQMELAGLVPAGEPWDYSPRVIR